MKKKHTAYRWILYLVGLACLATGMTINTKTGLGAAAAMSLPFTIAQLTNISLGDVTLGTYVIFIGLELVIHTMLERKRGIPTTKIRWLKDLAQFLVAIGVTRVINIISVLIPPLGEGLAGPFWDSIPVRILVLVFGVTITGVGAAITLNMRMVPNPVDGLVHAIADAWGKTVGFTKNCFDVVNVIISVALSLITGILVVYLLIVMMAPQLYDSILNLWYSLPDRIDSLVSWATKTFGLSEEQITFFDTSSDTIYEEIEKWVTETLAPYISSIVGGVGSIVTGERQVFHRSLFLR